MHAPTPLMAESSPTPNVVTSAPIPRTPPRSWVDVVELSCACWTTVRQRVPPQRPRPAYLRASVSVGRIGGVELVGTADPVEHGMVLHKIEEGEGEVAGHAEHGQHTELGQALESVR